MGAICLISYLLLRIVVTYSVSSGCGLNNKDKIFIGGTWLTKATVQADLGPAALDVVNSGQTTRLPSIDEEKFGQNYFSHECVLSALLGSILIDITGPKLLSREPTSVDDVEPVAVLPYKPKSPACRTKDKY